MGDIERTCPSKRLGLSNDMDGWVKVFTLFKLWSPEGIYGFSVRKPVLYELHPSYHMNSEVRV